MFANSVLEKILHGEYDFCGLCFKPMSEENQLAAGATADDEVVLKENSTRRVVKISEILSYVLGEDVARDISTFKIICIDCITTAVNSYKFIKLTKENAMYLTTAVENLSHSVREDQVPLNLDQCDTLFVTMNSVDLTMNLQYYDRLGPTHTKAEALEKFLSTASFLTPNKAVKAPEKVKKVIDVDVPLKRRRQVQILKKKNLISTVDMVHKGDMSVLCCKECLKEFPSVSNLRNHYLRLHAPKEFNCSECSRSFGTKSLLKAHQADSHINMVCSECGKTFNNMKTFKTHEQSHYVRIICPDCGRLYKNQTTYKKHLDNQICQTAVRHSPADAKFTCDYCGKKYTQKISLRVHIQYEHLNYKYHKCNWCDKKFWCKARLKAHIVKHTKEKNFICSICNGKFVTRESLLYHTRIHTGERPYPCPFCDSKFLSASRRQAHLKSQHRDPVIECDICQSKFKSLNQLIKHKQIHEPPKPAYGSINVDEVSEAELNKSVFPQKVKKESLVSLDDGQNQEEQKVIYNIIENEDEYELQTNKTEPQETVYLEMSEDGQYNLKVC